MNHESNGFVGVKVDILRRGQTQHDSASFVGAAVANEPPWRLGRKDGADQNRDGPDPLQSVRNAVGLAARRQSLVGNPDDAKIDSNGVLTH